MLYYDRLGKEIELWEFIHLCDDAEYKHVKAHMLADGTIIRTEWCGHDPQGRAPARIFRTKVQGGSSDGVVRWALSESEALTVHQDLLDLLEGHRSVPRWEIAVVAGLTMVAMVALLIAALFV